jgi:hypothetical protein
VSEHILQKPRFGRPAKAAPYGAWLMSCDLVWYLSHSLHCGSSAGDETTKLESVRKVKARPAEKMAELKRRRVAVEIQSIREIGVYYKLASVNLGGSGHPMPLDILKAVALAVAAGLAIQTQARCQTPCTTYYQSVTVTISTDGAAARVSPDPACVANGGTMSWTTADGESWSTSFDDDAHSPFNPGKTHHQGAVRVTRGDRVRKCSTHDRAYDAAAGACVFKYKASHTRNGQTSVIDPQVIVQPGT